MGDDILEKSPEPEQGSEQEPEPKRKPGRPKGSLNKSTIAKLEARKAESSQRDASSSAAARGERFAKCSPPQAAKPKRASKARLPDSESESPSPRPRRRRQRRVIQVESDSSPSPIVIKRRKQRTVYLDDPPVAAPPAPAPPAPAPEREQPCCDSERLSRTQNEDTETDMRSVSHSFQKYGLARAIAQQQRYDSYFSRLR